MTESFAAQPQPQYRADPKNGFGITALVVSIIGIIFGIIPFTGFVALICGVIALVFGLVGWSRKRKGKATNGKMSIIGSVLALVAMALGVWGIVIVFGAVNQLDSNMNCIGNAQSPAQVQQCNK